MGGSITTVPFLEDYVKAARTKDGREAWVGKVFWASQALQALYKCVKTIGDSRNLYLGDVCMLPCIQSMSCSDCFHSFPSCLIESLLETRKVVKHVSWFNHDEDGGLEGYETNQLRWSATARAARCLQSPPVQSGWQH